MKNIFQAINNGSLEQVKAAINEGADINESCDFGGSCPLHIAVREGNRNDRTLT